MKSNEVNTTVPETPQPVAQPEPVVQPSAEPVQPVAEPAPVAPAQPVDPVTTPAGMTPAQPTAPITPAPATPNAVAGIVAKLQALGIGPIIAIAVVAVVLVGGIVFSAVSSTPKSAFKGAINKIYKVSNVAIDSYETYLEDYDLTEHAAYVSGDFAIESNVEDLKEAGVNKLSLSYDAGVDYKNEVLSFGAELKGNKEKISLDAQYITDEIFIKSSLFEEVLKIDSEMMSELGIEVDFESLKEEIKTYEKEYNTDPETYEYLVKTVRDALIESLNSDYMEKEKEKIEVLDKEISVTKHTLELDDKAIKDMVEVIAEYLLEDEEFAKTLADATNSKKSDIKEALKALKKSAKDIEFEGDFGINVYTKGLFNTLVGFGFEVEGKEYVSVYSDGKNAEIIFDDHVGGEYGTKIVVTIEASGKGYKVVAKENKEKLLEMNIKEATDETIDADITAYEDGEKVGKIGVYLSVKQKKDSFSGEYKFRVESIEEEEYVEFSGKYTLNIKKKLEKMSGTKGAVSIEELDTDKVAEKIEEIAENDEDLGNLLEGTISSIEEEMLDLNSIGMVEVETSKAETLLTNNKATVLYVGEDYYSYYSEEEAYDFLYNIKSLQTELDFYSYFVDKYYVSTSLETALGNVTTNCVVPAVETPVEAEKPVTEGETTEGDKPAVEGETTTEGETSEEEPKEETTDDIPTNCIPSEPNYPALYLIKDGKVQKVLTQKATEEEIKTALAEIGIK